eukprot:GHVT01075141.1.p1 GENE.GHVT01075141.1~~GHVT01075141.1.p1  ORF type:complete len:396 (-),score=107.43 GHVT01075141.1:14-1093(-)
MGGTGTALRITRAALLAGKHVVSANKALLSKHLEELEGLLDESAKAGTAPPNEWLALRCSSRASLRFEAAVCGGIPIINALTRSFVADEVTKIVGIMNGTTNFILTYMQEQNCEYADALALASSLGYAEADPSADVLGWDARSKLVLLVRLAFKIRVKEEDVFTQGIADITKEDLKYAKMLNHTIKLLGIAEYRKDPDCDEPSSSSSSSSSSSCFSKKGKGVHLSVSPVLVPLASALAKIGDVQNAVEVSSKNLGCSVFTGPGAGRLPTANSIVADLEGLERLVFLNRGHSPPVFPQPFPPLAEAQHDPDIVSSFYLRYARLAGATHTPRNERRRASGQRHTVEWEIDAGGEINRFSGG